MLAIKNWLGAFETTAHGKRPAKRMLWASLPCDLQSRGYLLLMSSPQGPAHLGVFIALVQVVAALPKAIRDGRLIDGNERPLSIDLLSLKTHISVPALRESIQELKKVDWLYEVSETADNCGKSSADCGKMAAYRTRQDNTLQDATQHNTTAASESSSSDSLDGNFQTIPSRKENESTSFDHAVAFKELVAAYPAKGRIGLFNAEAAYRDALRAASDPSALHTEVVAAVTGKWADSKQWRDGFVQALSKFIQNQQWIDEPQSADGEGTPPVI